MSSNSQKYNKPVKFRVTCVDKDKHEWSFIVGCDAMYLTNLPSEKLNLGETMVILVELSVDEYDKLYKLILMMSSSLLPRLSEKAKTDTTFIPSDEENNSGHMVSYYHYRHVVEIYDDYNLDFLLSEDMCEKYNKDLADAIDRYLSTVYEYVRKLNAQKVIERIKTERKK